MDSIEKLAALFKRFPGVGPRQAERFVHFLLRSSASARRELADGIRELGASVHQCPSCLRFYSGERGTCSRSERFVLFLLRSSASARRELADGIRELGASVHQCPSCLRFYSGERGTCSICRDSNRSHELLIVATDADLSALERSRTYHGYYFVLGGTVHLASDKTDKLRLKEMRDRISELKSRYKDFSEIILAFPANPEGDATEALVKDELA